jgi:hypothetical protein
MQSQSVDLLHFLLQGLVYHAMALDQHQIIKGFADNSDFEMGFGAGRHIVHVTFIFDLQEVGIKLAGELLFDYGLD